MSKTYFLYYEAEPVDGKQGIGCRCRKFDEDIEPTRAFEIMSESIEKEIKTNIVVKQFNKVE